MTGGDFTRRILILFLCGLCLIPADAADTRPCVAVTFEGGPSGATESLLQALALRGIQATFLPEGRCLEAHPQMGQTIAEAGHELGLRSFSGTSMEGMSRKSMAREILDSQARLPRQCRPLWFRPPGGYCSDALLQVARARQLAVLTWSADPSLWRGPLNRRTVLQNIHDGDVLLLRDDSALSVRKALTLLDILQKEGFRLVTASQLATLRRIPPKAGQCYASFPSAK